MKIGYPRVQRSSGRMGNCLPKIRWNVRIPIRRKRYSHKETQTYSHPPSTIKNGSNGCTAGEDAGKTGMINVLPSPSYFPALGLDSGALATHPKEHFAKNDAMNSSELWYSTVRHDIKREASVTNINNQTEYALINVPKGKKNIASTEQHNEYDYVLI